MTTTTGPRVHTLDAAADTTAERSSTEERPLRLALSVDAAASAVAAGVTFVLRDEVADRAGLSVGLVIGVAAVVAVWAVDIGLLSRASRAHLLRWTPLVAALNGLWVAATAVALVTGAVERDSWWFLAPVALLVGDFALAQWWTWRRTVNA